MHYLTGILTMIPVVLITSIGIYAILYFLLKRRRKRPTPGKMVLEWILTGWLLTFIYITQIMPFGNGMGEILNLKPFVPFYVAIRYGSQNASMLDQYFLNILMFVPLGILLPIVFQKGRSFFCVLKVSAGLSFLTEVTQLLGKRGTDMDDLIANILGGLVGFSIFVIGCGLWKKRELITGRYKRNLIAACVILVLVALPFGVISTTDSLRPYGQVYYGHLQPEKVKIPDTISEEGSSAIVYKYEETEKLEDLKERLIKETGFSGEFILKDQIWTLEDGDEKRIFIYDYNLWSVMYSYGAEKEIDKSLLPSMEEGIHLALFYMEKYGISGDTMYLDKASNDWGDDLMHLEFKDTREGKESIYWGSVDVALGENGELESISDGRLYCTYEKEVETITPRASIEIAQNVGVGAWDGTAEVKEVKPWHYFNADTGYLIPTWYIKGEFISDGEEEYPWLPNIEAVK